MQYLGRIGMNELLKFCIFLTLILKNCTIRSKIYHLTLMDINVLVYIIMCLK